MDDDQGCIDPRLLQINSPANVSFDEIPFSDAGISELSDTHPLASPIDLDVDPSCWNDPISESSTYGNDGIHPIDHGEWPDRMLAGPIFSSSDANSAFGRGQAPISYSQRAVPLESNISESVTRKLRAKAKSSSSKPTSAETWQPLKNIVRSKWKSRNESCQNVMNLLKTRYEFHATKNMCQKKFKEWGMKKNKQKQSDGDERFARHRGQPADSVPDRPLWIPPGVSSSSYTWDEMVNLMHDLLPKYPHDAFRPFPEARDAERPWEMLYFQCSGVCALACLGLQARLVPAMQELFQKCRDACNSPDLGFLIYFWKICLALRDMRLRGAPRVLHRGREGVVQSRSQRAAKAEFPVLRAFLKFLRDALKDLTSHPLFSLIVWLQDSYEASPRFFKESLRWAFSRSIMCLEKRVGDNHPIVINIKSHFAGSWRSEEFPTSSIRERYDQLVIHTQREFGETSMEAMTLLRDYTFAMSICGSKKGSQKATELALILRHSTLTRVQDPCEALTCNSYTRAYIFSIELLSSDIAGKCGSHLTSRNTAYLQEAVNVLVDGNVECRIWAAHFSKRLCTWYKGFKGKTTFRCKDKKDEPEARKKNALLVKMTREALKKENARLVDVRWSIFGPKKQIRTIKDSSQSVEPGDQDNQSGVSGHATMYQYGAWKCRGKQRKKKLRLRRKQEESGLVSFLVDVTSG